MIYLDHNATSPIRPAVKAAMVAALDIVGNPSSVHRAGVAARRVVEAARQALAEAVGALPGQVVFTSGGTEANTTILRAFAGRPVFISAIEHDSVLAVPVAGAVRIPVTPGGAVDLAALEQLLGAAVATGATVPARPGLVSVMLVNNETGVIQPVRDVARIAHAYGFEVHCDAVQALGKLPVDMQDLGVDLLTLGFHKCGGPRGVGAMVANDLELIQPLLVGGRQEQRRRAGTENVVALAGVAALLAELGAVLAEQARLAVLRDRIEAALPEAVVLGRVGERVGNTSCLALPGMSAETQVLAFDLAGIALSAGAACASGAVRRSHVLEAMGIPEAVAATAIRVSLGWTTTAADVDQFITIWQGLSERTLRHVA
jgi:cysteine desulfurase